MTFDPIFQSSWRKTAQSFENVSIGTLPRVLRCSTTVFGSPSMKSANESPVANPVKLYLPLRIVRTGRVTILGVIARVDAAELDRVRAGEPGRGATQRIRRLAQVAERVLALILDARRPVRRRELELRKAGRVHRQRGNVDAELRPDVARDERAPAIAIVDAEAAAELVDHTAGKDSRPPVESARVVVVAVHSTAPGWSTRCRHFPPVLSNVNASGVRSAARADEDRVLLRQLVVDATVSAFAAAIERKNLAGGAESAIRACGLIRQRIEKVDDAARSRIDALRGNAVTRERCTNHGMANDEGRGREVAGPHRGRGHDRLGATTGAASGGCLRNSRRRTSVRDHRPAKVRAVAVIVGVGIWIVALDSSQGLTIRQRVELVRVVVGEPHAMKPVCAALGRHDDAHREAAMYLRLPIRQHLYSWIASRPGAAFEASPEDSRAGRLAVLDIRRAVGAAAEELDAVEAADDVGIEREEVLHVAAVSGKVAKLLLVDPADDRGALERDVVLPFGADGDHVLEAADFEAQIRVDDRGRARNTRPVV